MARRVTALFTMLALGCIAGWAIPPASPKPRAAPPAGMVQVSLGDSMISLYGPWKFTTGDSVIDPATNSLLWAEPGFDDAKWETVQLTPQDAPTAMGTRLSDYAPYWTAKSQPGYWGYAWYRIRVQVEVKRGQRLAITGPADEDGAYQAFDNGRLVGSLGNFSNTPPAIYSERPTMFALPSSQQPDAAPQMHVLAFRVWMQPKTLTESESARGLQTAPMLGELGAVSAQHRLLKDERMRASVGLIAEAVVFGLLGLCAIGFGFFRRSDRVYFPVGAVFLLIAASCAIALIGGWTQRLSANVVETLRFVLLDPLVFAGWVVVWRRWLDLRRPVWISWALVELAGLLVMSMSLALNLFFNPVPANVSHDFALLSLGLRVTLAILMLFTVGLGIAQRRPQGWLVLPAALLVCIAEFSAELSSLRFWPSPGIPIHLREIADLLLAAILTELLAGRLVLAMRRQRQSDAGGEQSHEAKQIVCSGTPVTLPGLHIESEFLAVDGIGGDFLQIIPDRTDGSVVIVAGEVAGKGWKAGMQVALLVGAIRTAAELKVEPLPLLQALNRRLLDYGDAYARCLAINIARHGVVTAANAGHVTPYLNAAPLALDGALPLGFLEDAEFATMNFPLSEGDRLVLMSDGIAGAANGEHGLFGFERATDLVRTASGPAEIAAAAQKFGQRDDISVITITRTSGWRVRWHD